MAHLHTATIKQHVRNAIRQSKQLLYPLLYHTIGLRHPRHTTLSHHEALRFLTSLHPDHGSTCICSNTIQADHDLHIIIPVHNTSAYLAQCLQSVVSQNSRHTTFITIINDGSTDSSGQIIDSFHTSLKDTELYHNIEIIHQDNRGLSGARNRALDNIRGRYVMFLDSDDMLLPGAVDSLMQAALASGADITEGNFNTGPTHGCACGKVYSSHLFENVHFPPGYLFEDTLNIFYLYPLSRKTIQIPGVHYFYRENPTSIMHSFQGTTKAVDSLWVSQRILTDYFSQGHHATRQLFQDYLTDILGTAQHFRTLNNEKAMQAMFAIHCHISDTHFHSLITDPVVCRTLPSQLKSLAQALCTRNYRAFRITSM